MIVVVGGCRAIVGIEDVTVGDGGTDGGTSGDAAADATTFAECRTKCAAATPTGESALFNNIDNCLCDGKIARVCPAECNDHCDQGGSVQEPCRACVLQAITDAKLQCTCNGGGTGSCTTYVNCIKTCPK
jgi:hypothetical protein